MKHFITLMMILLFGLPALAMPGPTGQTEHAKVTLTSEIAAITPGQPFHIAFDFELEDHWHIYWKNPGDSGLAPAVHWEIPAGFAVGDIQWPAPERIEIEGLTNYGYEGTPSLVQKMIPPNGLEGEAFTLEGNEVILHAKLEWLICKEVCIPEATEVSLTLPVSDKSLSYDEAFQSRFKKMPQAIEGNAYYESREDAIYLQLPQLVSGEVYFYPEVGGIIEHAMPQQLLAGNDYSVLKLTKGLQPIEGPMAGVLETKEGSFQLLAEPGMVTVPEAAPPVQDLSLFAALLFALLGGVLLNAMPCVFPVLSLKALAIARKSDKAPAEARKHGLAYLAGVVASFLVLGGLMIALKEAGHTLGWGFQLQSPVFVTAMLILFFLLGLSLAGMFHLPVLLGSAAQNAEQKDSTKGSFLTGVLAVLVATPCAVPFMAPAVGYAFAQPAAVTLLIMVALGFGLALPYLLLAWFPAMHGKLPKPGEWMNRFKEFMAFPMFASAAWLLWVLAQQVSLDSLALVMFVLVGLAFLIWMRGRWTIVAAIVLVGFALWSVFEASQPEYTDSYHELSEPFTPQRLAELRAEGKPVFVNATAAWCITCKVNERVALRDTALAEAFKQQGITYLVADWTNHDDAITGWLTRYGRSGVPLYVYYPAKGGQEVVLPQLLTTSIILDAIKEN